MSTEAPLVDLIDFLIKTISRALISDVKLNAATISVITSDGRNIVGTLRGYDQKTNLILDKCHERVYSSRAGVEQIVLGLYVIRGDNIAVVGELDDDLDKELDLGNTRAAPLKSIVHN